MLKPIRRVSRDPVYREWLHLSDKLRNIPPESESSVKLSGFITGFSDASSLLNMYENIFMNETYRFKASRSEPVIIDCGANIGISVLWLAKNYPGARILAFEPDPSLFSLLKRNVEENNIRAELRNEAVGNQNTLLRFSGSKKQDGCIDENGSISVKGIRLKEVMEQFEQIDFLKLDVEGAEVAVLKDCCEILPRIKNLFVEFHFKNNDLRSTLPVIQLLCEAGFSCLMQAPVYKNPFSAIKDFQTLEIVGVQTPV